MEKAPGRAPSLDPSEGLLQSPFPSYYRLPLRIDSGWSLSLTLKPPTNPFSSKRSPTSSEQGLACAISVLSGIFLRTDSCFQFFSDVKLFPWPLTQLLWAGSLPHHCLLPPARLLLFPPNPPKFSLVSRSILRRPGGGS